MADCEDPDQMHILPTSHSVSSDLDLHHLPLIHILLLKEQSDQGPHCLPFIHVVLREQSDHFFYSFMLYTAEKVSMVNLKLLVEWQTFH